MTYAEKLRDPRWQKRRLQILDGAGWKCSSCEDSKSTLHVHHKRYFKGRDPWDYDDDQLVVLCEQCHELAHRDKQILDEVISRFPDEMSQNLACLLAGYGALDGYLDIDLLNSLMSVDRPTTKSGAFAWLLGNLSEQDVSTLLTAFNKKGPDWFVQVVRDAFLRDIREAV